MVTINSKQLKEVLQIMVPKKEPILVVGTPGVGKTDIVLQVTKELDADIIIMHPVTSDPTDFKGFPVNTFNQEKDRDEAHFLPFGDLQKLIDATKLTVCFFDDFGQAPPSVQAAAMQLILGRRINGFKVSDEVVFIAATNRKQDRAGVNGILEPVKSRFTIFSMVPDLEGWCEWALKTDIHPALIQFIRYRPSLLNDFNPTSDMSNSPNPRTIATCSRHLKLSMSKDIEFASLVGAAGEGFAIELSAFIDIYRALPDADSIINEPKKFKAPKELDKLFAICGAISYRVTKENFANIIEISEKLTADFRIMMIKDCLIRNSELVKTDEFREWVKNNKDFIL